MLSCFDPPVAFWHWFSSNKDHAPPPQCICIAFVTGDHTIWTWDLLCRRQVLFHQWAGGTFSKLLIRAQPQYFKRRIPIFPSNKPTFLLVCKGLCTGQTLFQSSVLTLSHGGMRMILWWKAAWISRREGLHCRKATDSKVEKIWLEGREPRQYLLRSPHGISLIMQVGLL